MTASRMQELMLYLLQLVQALKFDSASFSGLNSRRDREQSPPSSVALSHDAAQISPSTSAHSSLESGLADFLIRRACDNAVLGNNLYWYLQVECDDRRYGKMFKRVRASYLDSLSHVSKKHVDPLLSGFQN